MYIKINNFQSNFFYPLEQKIAIDINKTQREYT